MDDRRTSGPERRGLGPDRGHAQLREVQCLSIFHMAEVTEELSTRQYNEDMVKHQSSLGSKSIRKGTPSEFLSSFPFSDLEGFGPQSR